MTIHTLQLGDGTYRRATYRDILIALTCGHTEHLQTERGIVAFRPFERDGRKWVSLDYTNNANRFDDASAEFQITKRGHYSPHSRDPYAAIRWAYYCLNGDFNCTLEPGDSFEVEANQGTREATVLAVIGEQALIEYEMPGNVSGRPTSALWIVTVLGEKWLGDRRNVSYNNVPKKWLRAIRDAEMTDWVGMGQRSVTRIPFPEL